MRGTPRTHKPKPLGIGIIPAHAGNTCAVVRRAMEAEDHPRTCGEHTEDFFFCWDEMGSSPHMRGTLCAAPCPCRQGGIIPAHAGNTRANAECGCHKWDHPRTCGEHQLYTSSQFAHKGSSPHMRGTLIVIVVVGLSGGIIPAHAGNTQAPPRPASCRRDHPRTCGEHRRLPVGRVLRSGSSPHMRGTLAGLESAVDDQGIIPAHAGNTLTFTVDPACYADHPRTCGEHTSRLAQYRGFLIRSVCFLFSFILSTSLPAGTYWHCSIHDEEHRQKTLPSYWMAV